MRSISLSARVLILVAALGWSVPGRADVPTVAAASDLKFALEEIATAYTAAGGKPVKLAFGSSGNFARQIRQGAPFEIFMSADESFVEGLARDGFARDAGELYAVGRIVMFASAGSALEPDPALDSLKKALESGRVRRFAIANPEHAPYGRAAKEALEAVGLWAQIQKRLVLGENVSQAAQFATTGGADGGIFAYSLALSPAVGRLGRFVLIPESMHRPLRQRMVLLKSAGPTAGAFYAFVKSAEARRIFDRYGFVLPR
jgi:molybdate transport system substrate-binding protein